MAVAAPAVPLRHFARLKLRMDDASGGDFRLLEACELVAVGIEGKRGLWVALAEASKNPFMRSVGNLIEAALVGIFKLSSPAADRDKIAGVAESHAAIVEAIARHDAPGARQAMEHVILVGMERVRAALAAR